MTAPRGADAWVLAAQRTVDRLARWARLVPSPAAGRRFLVVQIDGLSAAVLDRALAEGRMPGLARLLASGQLVRRPLSVGLPSSTPAFQAALMYGVAPDIPGFHFYDKRRRRDVYFPRPGLADALERAHARGRRGIMEGGACYGCVFTGGAAEGLWTMARLLRPAGAGGALARLPLSALLLAWVVVKCVVLTGLELSRAFLRLVADPVTEGRRGLRWLLVKIGLGIWTRQLFTLAASAALYRGTRAVYVNYLEYDVYAHAFGPAHRLALRSLTRVDRSLRQLARILRRLPEHGYDLYVLSDHGQAATRPFARVAGGRSLEAVVRAALDEPTAPGPPAGARADDGAARLRAQLRGYRQARRHGLVQRFLTYLERDFPRWLRPEGADGGLRVVAAGPNAFVYFTDRPEPLDAAAVEARCPGLAARLSRHRGIGFVLARGPSPVCWYRGTMIDVDSDAPGGPFAGRPDRALVVQGLRELMAMPSAGDLVLYGIGAPAGDVSFLDERGAHGGPSPAELATFFIHPSRVAVDAAALTHPVRLYPHFLAYLTGQEPGVPGPGAARAGATTGEGRP
jgi:hypothetical protein